LHISFLDWKPASAQIVFVDGHYLKTPAADQD
jgi:prepilin-type processing-associated H-X9-DG protein